MCRPVNACLHPYALVLTLRFYPALPFPRDSFEMQPQICQGTAIKWKVQDLSRLFEAKVAKNAARMLPRIIFPLI